MNTSTEPLRIAGLAIDDVSMGYEQDLVHSRPIKTHGYIKRDGQGEIDNECRQRCSCDRSNKMNCRDPADIDAASEICKC